MEKEKVVFGPWYGEFNYEMNWYAPRMRRFVKDNHPNSHVISVSYPGRNILYEDFAEFVPYPDDVVEKLGTGGSEYNDNPDPAIEFAKSLGGTLVTPHQL